jgi:Trp operon repressor
MKCNQSINQFIAYLARKIATVYPSNCADEEDYIQVGHLTLAEISRDEHEYRNFQAYVIVAIANTMRNAALDAMCAASAPRRVKKQVHKVKMLLAAGNAEREICQELNITPSTFANLRSLIFTESWHMLFQEPTRESEPFSVLDDLLSSGNLTAEDRAFLQAKFSGTSDNLGLSRKQRYSRAKSLRSKLVRSGYGI